MKLNRKQGIGDSHCIVDQKIYTCYVCNKSSVKTYPALFYAWYNFGTHECMVSSVCFRDGTLAHCVTHSVGVSLSTPG